MDFHDCTDDEIKEFYPVKQGLEKLLNSISKDADRGLYCIDWTDDLEIDGNFDMSYIEILYAPCNYLFTENGYEGDSVSEECIWN